MSGNAFRGVSAEQDARFGNKEKKLLKTLAKTFPIEYKTKVDLTLVNWEAMRGWIATRLTELLGGVEDDVLIGYAFGQLEEKKDVDPRLLQINLTGFLGKNSSVFCKELWTLLISAASNPSGIPQQFLDEKAAEIRQREAERQLLQDNIQSERARQEKLRAEHVVAAAERERSDRRRSRSRSRSISPPDRRNRQSRRSDDNISPDRSIRRNGRKYDYDDYRGRSRGRRSPPRSRDDRKRRPSSRSYSRSSSSSSSSGDSSRSRSRSKSRSPRRKRERRSKEQDLRSRKDGYQNRSKREGERPNRRRSPSYEAFDDRSKHRSP